MQNPQTHQTHTGAGDIVNGPKNIHNHYYNQVTNPPPFIPFYLNTIPYVMPPQIVGREDDNKIVKQRLQNGKSLLLINTIGGVGKTTLAIYYAQQHGADYAHILWLNGSRSIADELLNDTLLLQNLHIHDTVNALRQAQKYEAAKNCVLAALSALPKPVLWLVDNINEENYTTIKQWQNTFTQHHFLMTTRGEYDTENSYRLPYLSDAAARKLFYMHATRIAQSQENDTILQPLLHLVRNHSLTIALLAKTCQNKGSSTFPEFIEKYKQGIFRTTEGIKIKDDNYPDQAYIHAILSYVFNTTDIATDKPALHLLTQLSVMPSDNLSHTILAELLITDSFSADDLDNSTNTLLQTGWLEQPDTTSTVYFCHPLIQEVIRHTEKIDFEKSINFIDRLSFYIKDGLENQWWNTTKWIPYAENILLIFKNDIISLLDIYHHLSMIFTKIDNFNKALDMCLNGIEIIKTNNIKKDKWLYPFNNQLSLIYKELGLYKKSITVSKEMLKIIENTKIKNYDNLALIYNNLAISYDHLNDYENGLKYYLMSLDTLKKKPKIKSVTLELLYSNIGLCYTYLNDFKNAKKFLTKSLDIREKLNILNHVDTATTFNSLGVLYDKKFDFETALEFYKKALEIQCFFLDKNHTMIALTYYNMANAFNQIFYEKNPEIYNKNTKIYIEDALTYSKRALTIYKAKLDRKHPDLSDAIEQFKGILSIVKRIEDKYFYELANDWFCLEFPEDLN